MTTWSRAQTSPAMPPPLRRLPRASSQGPCPNGHCHHCHVTCLPVYAQGPPVLRSKRTSLSTGHPVLRSKRTSRSTGHYALRSNRTSLSAGPLVLRSNRTSLSTRRTRLDSQFCSCGQLHYQACHLSMSFLLHHPANMLFDKTAPTCPARTAHVKQVNASPPPARPEHAHPSRHLICPRPCRHPDGEPRCGRPPSQRAPSPVSPTSNPHRHVHPPPRRQTHAPSPNPAPLPAPPVPPARPLLRLGALLRPVTRGSSSCVTS